MEPAPRRARRPSLYELVLFLAVATYAAWFTYEHWTGNIVHPPAALEKLCAYEAETPYQNRVLVPTLVRGFEASGLGRALGITPQGFALGLEGACVIAFFNALRALVARFLPGARASAASAALGLYALPFLYVLPQLWPYWYPWDVPAVLFTTLGVLWIHDERWSHYYWLFPFATLNRETTAFLIAVFALTQLGRMPWYRLAVHVGVQAALWLCLKWLLSLTFENNGGVGDVYANALEENWALRTNLASWGTLALVYGFLWLPLLALAPFVRESFVRRALLVVPLFFAVCYKLAQFDEVRVYGEMLPLVVLGVACGASGLSRVLARGAAASSAP